MEPIVYSNPTVNIELTDSAILQLLERTEGKGVSEIRLGITGGGCGGYEYIFDYNTTNDPSDQVIDFGKFTIHIDNLSRPYLNNLVLDYVKKGINEEFTFENPNVQATCGNCSRGSTCLLKKRSRQNSLQVLLHLWKLLELLTEEGMSVVQVPAKGS